MGKENETGNAFTADVSQSLYYLNAQVEMLDSILEKGGAITIRRIERMRTEKLNEIQILIKENCG
jgi:hypothetical protein